MIEVYASGPLMNTIWRHADEKEKMTSDPTSSGNCIHESPILYLQDWRQHSIYSWKGLLWRNFDDVLTSATKTKCLTSHHDVSKLKTLRRFLPRNILRMSYAYLAYCLRLDVLLFNLEAHCSSTLNYDTLYTYIDIYLWLQEVIRNIIQKNARSLI